MSVGNVNNENLRAGIAIAHSEFECAPNLTEELLAAALRLEAPKMDNPKLLLGIADALDNPQVKNRLRFLRASRGAPKSQDTLRPYTIARFVAEKTADGVKQESAIAMVMDKHGIKRSTAMKDLSLGRKILDAVARLDIEDEAFLDWQP